MRFAAAGGGPTLGDAAGGVGAGGAVGFRVTIIFFYFLLIAALSKFFL